MNKSMLDASIPILTEVIEEHPAQEPATPAETRAEAPLPEPATETPRIDGWIEEEWTRLERKVSERVLAQLLERVDFVLEQRIRDSLADVLQVAVSGLASEIREGLQHTLEEVIARATTQEIARLQNTKK